MSGKGKGLFVPSTHGRGKGPMLGMVPVRRRRITYGLSQEATTLRMGTVRRLCRRAGITRLRMSDVQPYVDAALKAWLAGVLEKAVTVTEGGGRNTISALDVLYGMQADGRSTVWGV